MRKEATHKLQQTLLRWYRAEGRDFPWRRTRDPYRILVSEVMLQQTQTGRVLRKYPGFIRRFPNVRSLARARRSSVIREWRGMGYNNRAVRLHELAQIVSANGGSIPSEYGDLILLPGIGRYSANAILSFSFGLRVPVVETNIRRVLSRLLFRMADSSGLAASAVIWREAERMLPLKKSADWNQALMDLGATICTAGTPSCFVCPVKAMCASSGVMARAPAAQRKREPSLMGIPNRIYRGRIVDLLRNRERGMTISRMGARVCAGFRPAHLPWLTGLLASLERDGLIAITAARSGQTGTVRLAG